MTTGRINQVANPLFVSFVAARGGQPAAELQRSAVPGLERGSTPRTGGLGEVLPFSPDTAAFRWWCWGQRGPFAHPWGVCEVCEPTGPC